MRAYGALQRHSSAVKCHENIPIIKQPTNKDLASVAGGIQRKTEESVKQQ